jgi:rhodanese-related sulfurtransferase
MTVKTIKAQELYQHIKLGHNVVLIDVRSVEEYDRCHIKGAISYPLESFHAQALIHRVLARFPSPPTIYITCASGNDAPIAAQHLVSSSYDFVCVLQGGTKAWLAQKLPVIKKQTVQHTVSLSQQMQIAMGCIVTLASLFGTFVHPVFHLFAFLAGVGYTYEAIFNTQYLKNFLLKASWNQEI